ncbi:MAG: hypothetical protein A2Z18_00645 [Armatimonadetes bacterium RBG_16_58_9]|nr:MAG: hypothetical protein A2Z18_00645 [Armatimonadetes bacterium RBG_16_58_9]
MKLIGLLVFAALIAVSSACAAEEIAPLAIRNASIGGGALNQYTPGVEGGTGLNNIGLLIRTWGSVTYVDPAHAFFYIDDGASRTDGSGHVGVRIACDNLAPGNSITPPAEDSYAIITGISSTILIGGKVQPNVRPRRQADIQVI